MVDARIYARIIVHQSQRFVLARVARIAEVRILRSKQERVGIANKCRESIATVKQALHREVAVCVNIIIIICFA